MDRNTLILGQDQFYSLDTHKTQLNNNVLVVGTSGAGKTRSIVTPNLLQMSGSYIISDPKGNLYDKYKDLLRENGYRVKKLDFTNPMWSSHYNFFHYIRNTQDIVKIAHMLVYQRKQATTSDPFWEESGRMLVEALIAYLYESKKIEDKYRNLSTILRLVDSGNTKGDLCDSTSSLDLLMQEHEELYPDSFAVEAYKRCRVSPDRTLRCIYATVSSKLSLLDSPQIREMTADDNIYLSSIGKKKTALFVVVSDTDRSMDPLANLFFTQAMNELCRVADVECRNQALPIPVRFILDDFATNCKIEEFPRMISSIRSRNISVMLMIQAESQLAASYGEDGATIIGNCDTYVYMGGNDLDTAQAVARRCDVPVRKILYMPVGTNWIFRRGQEPVNGKNLCLEEYLDERGYLEKKGRKGYEKVHGNRDLRNERCAV